MIRPSLLGGQEAHEGMDLDRILTSLLGSFVIWGVTAGVCLWSLDCRSLFCGGYELVTFRHIQSGLATFSEQWIFKALRELLMPPEPDSPVRRWTRWIPLTWLNLPTCLASLLAMPYLLEALTGTGRSCPISSYKSHPLLPPFFTSLAELAIDSLGLVWIRGYTSGINRPVAVHRRVVRKGKRFRDFLITSQRVRFAAAGVTASAVTLGTTLPRSMVRSAGPLASLSVTQPASIWILGGTGITAMLISVLWFFCRIRQGNDPYLVVKWIDYLAIIAVIAVLPAVFTLLPEAQRLFLFSRF